MATNPFSERLNEVMRLKKIPTVQEFVALLNVSLEKPIPYATASRYHAGREPPVTYLQAVARAFGVSPQWLLLGRGDPMAKREAADPTTGARETEERLEHTVHDAARRLEAAVNTGEVSGPGTSELARVQEGDFPFWLAPLAELQLRLWVGEIDEDPMTPATDHHRLIAQAVRAPLEAWGIDARPMQEEGMWGNYVSAITPALFILAEARSSQVRDAALSRAREEEPDA